MQSGRPVHHCRRRQLGARDRQGPCGVEGREGVGIEISSLVRRTLCFETWNPVIVRTILKRPYNRLFRVD
jgi:hypothetical protein